MGFEADETSVNLAEKAVEAHGKAVSWLQRQLKRKGTFFVKPQGKAHSWPRRAPQGKALSWPRRQLKHSIIPLSRHTPHTSQRQTRQRHGLRREGSTNTRTRDTARGPQPPSTRSCGCRRGDRTGCPRKWQDLGCRSRSGEWWQERRRRGLRGAAQHIMHGGP